MTIERTREAPTAFPPGRYGRRREPRRAPRWVVPALALGVVAAGMLVAVQLYRQYADPPYRGEVLAYSDITDRQVVVRLRVNKPTGKAATCIVRARAANGEEVGRAEVAVPADAPGSVTFTYRLETSQRPVYPEVEGCTAART